MICKSQHAEVFVPEGAYFDDVDMGAGRFGGTNGSVQCLLFEKCRRAKNRTPKVAEVGEIRFKNYYVAYLTVKAKYRNTETRDTGDSKWKTPIRRMKLMPNPHCETGSQDYFSITRKHFRTHLVNITAVRLILQQPSPVCKDFKLEDLKLFHSNENWKTPGLPGWLTDDPLEGKNEKQSIEGLPSLDTISAGLQNMWALSENISTQPIGTTFGRFDVDGCYDINLLSYT